MIIRPIHRISILYVLQGSFFARLIWPLLILFLFSCGVSYYQNRISTYHVPLNAGVFTLLGIALAIYHGFCNNAAYERFWEGRKLWGSLIWQARVFARQVTSLPNLLPEERNRLLYLTIAFCHALRHQLRHESTAENVHRLLDADDALRVMATPHSALMLTQLLGETVGKMLKDGKIDSIIWQQLNTHIDEFARIQSACERINNTPIPFAYFVLMHRTVYGYCFLLPFGLASSIGWVTPIMVTFVGYTFMALNEIVDEISEPFGKSENDIALTHICQTIETQLCEIGQLTLPAYHEEQSNQPYIYQ